MLCSTCGHPLGWVEGAILAADGMERVPEVSQVFSTVQLCRHVEFLNFSFDICAEQQNLIRSLLPLRPYHLFHFSMLALAR